MLECVDCHVYFFTVEGLREHDKLCIGYKPQDDYGERKSTILM